MKKILIDTSAYSRFLAGDQNLLDIIGSAEIVYMSIFVLGELYAGFSGGNKEQENRQALHNFLLVPTVKILNATAETAELFGFVKAGLAKAGTPLPINDVWIAGHVMESGATLVTYDAHFRKIEGIRLWTRI